jgi:hypothetical protein
MEQLRRQADSLAELARQTFDKSHPVDEYISTPGIPSSASADAAPVGFSFAVELQPTYYMPEKIESILYGLPVGCTGAVAKLGDRYISLFPQQASSPVPVTPAVPLTTVPVQNTNAYPVDVTITGGTVTSVTVNGVQVGTGDGTYLVNSGNTIAITYSVAPTWAWVNATSVALTEPYTGHIDGIGIILSQDDDRLMLLNGVLTTGPTHFELMGFADAIFGVV